MSDAPTTMPSFTRAGVFDGMRQTIWIGIFVMPFGIAFGVSAVQQGMTPTLAMLMSALVMAGGSQFAALDLWAAPLPVVPILLATAAINARHVLYGAALYPWVRGLPAHQLYPSALVMVDLNWAMAMQARQRGYYDVGLLLGSGIVMVIVWLTSVAIGLVAGSAIGDPRQWGIDAVMPCVFAATLTAMWRGTGDVAPWGFAAVTAYAAYLYLPPGWHVVVGAIAGGVLGLMLYREPPPSEAPSGSDSVDSDGPPAQGRETP
ncbi:MAG: AzlC family ABC transporter permease [Pseudomonadota bacterium]